MIARTNRNVSRWSLVALLLVAGGAAGAGALEIKDAKVVDLTYVFGPETVYWPTAKRFEMDIVAQGKTEGGYFYSANNFCAAEHGGTHMDAPIHFAEGKPSVDQIPVTAGIGPLVKVDVSAAAAKDPDYRLTVDDLRGWEKKHGKIPRGAIVVMYSGWGKRWPDRISYLGTDIPGDVKNLHFPGFSKEAATFLVESRQIDAIGVDTPSIDHGPSKDFIVHQIINGASKPGLENLANLDSVPEKGATLIALPMKIEGGSGGPLRAIAILP
jgi:kynurenine formamidase